jgi:dTMP kinase
MKAGAVVCADRYAYTAFARDVVRGVSRRWVRNLYRFAIRPNLAFYFRVPLEVALGRILGGRDAIKYYEAGMDLGLSRNIVESFRLFQGRILEEYDSMADEMGFHVIDATAGDRVERNRPRLARHRTAAGRSLWQWSRGDRYSSTLSRCPTSIPRSCKGS